MEQRRCLGCMELFEDGLQVCPSCGYVVGTPAEEAIHMDPGTILHEKYIVGKVLGYGGFGVTYIGWDMTLEQKVAIKEYLPSEFSTRMPGETKVMVFGGEKTEQFISGMEKFVEEAKHLAKFQKEEGIVIVYDSFLENETAYIIMEYLDGETLTDYLKQVDTIPEKDAIQMLLPIMDSLSIVHEEGILHRDIAPDNIYITKTGQVKLIDFGASRYATTTHSRSLTVIIKQGYSPEEQYRSRGDQGPHTDVYALAATLYKMLTGKTPPDAMERRAMYESKSKDILIPPRKINKGISRNVENAILNAMNVQIADRTPTVEQFKQELLSEEPVSRVYGKIKKIDVYAWPVWLKAALATALICVVAFAGLLISGFFDFDLFNDEVIIPEGITVVPDVEGLTKSEAVEEIEAEEMFPMIAGTIESEYIPAGLIVVQDPVGGTYAEKGGMVHLTVCSGKAAQEAVDGVSTVPYVEGDTEADAVQKLETAGLGQPNIRYENSETVREGHVISQSINAGTEVEEGTVLDLVVSRGPASFSMPDVTGMGEEEAYSLLTSKGLTVKREYARDESVPVDHVISQDIPSGRQVKRGDTVSLVISSGKKTVTVPDVKGKTKEDATSLIKDAKLKVTVLENYDAEVGAGLVISQSPAAGTSQITGSTVTIYVSKGKQPVQVNFAGNGGTASSDAKSVYYMDTYGNLPTASRTGYTFTGWYTSAADGAQVTASSTVSTTSNHVLYAHWTANNYTVMLDANTGSVSPGSISVTYDATYSGLPTPAKEGHSFEGWFTAPSGGSQISSGTKVSITSTQTLYAHWSVNSYPITASGLLDGAQSGSTEGYGTFDVTVGGQLVANDVTSYSGTFPYGTSYSIDDCKAQTGIRFDGVSSGSASGTIGLSNSVVLQFNTITLEYTVRCVSTNGSLLDTTTVSGKYGTSIQYDPPSFFGYKGASRRTITFDSLDNQVIEVAYTPNGPTYSEMHPIYYSAMTNPTGGCEITTEYTNRTASTVQARITVTVHAYEDNPNGIIVQVTYTGGGSGSSGEVVVSGPLVANGSASASSGWFTISGLPVTAPGLTRVITLTRTDGSTWWSVTDSYVLNMGY